MSVSETTPERRRRIGSQGRGRSPEQVRYRQEEEELQLLDKLEVKQQEDDEGFLLSAHRTLYNLHTSPPRARVPQTVSFLHHSG